MLTTRVISRLLKSIEQLTKYIILFLKDKNYKKGGSSTDQAIHAPQVVKKTSEIYISKQAISQIIKLTSDPVLMVVIR